MEILKKMIESIHYEDNMYLVVNHNKSIEFNPEIENAEELASSEMNKWINKIRNNSVYYADQPFEVTLYSGRIKIGGRRGTYGYMGMFVDGIKTLVLDDRKEPNRLDCQWICNYLNAIETYGVDGFLENYKTSLKEHVEHLKIEVDALQLLVSDENTPDGHKIQYRRDIFDARKFISLVMTIILLLNLHMNLAIENENAQTAFSKIIELFS